MTQLTPDSLAYLGQLSNGVRLREAYTGADLETITHTHDCLSCGKANIYIPQDGRTGTIARGFHNPDMTHHYCNTVSDDWYILTGITDGEDSFPCLKCGNTVHPWHVNGCEGCGDLHPATAPAPATWACGECGTRDHESEIDAERCCSPFYCVDCGYDRADLREACKCPPLCTECGREITIVYVECSADYWRTTPHLSPEDLPEAVYSECYGGAHCQPCYEHKGGEWEEEEADE